MKNLYSEDKEALKTEIVYVIGGVVRARENCPSDFNFTQFEQELEEWMVEGAKKHGAQQVHEAAMIPLLQAIESNGVIFAARQQDGARRAPCSLLNGVFTIFTD